MTMIRSQRRMCAAKATRAPAVALYGGPDRRPFPGVPALVGGVGALSGAVPHVLAILAAHVVEIKPTWSPTDGIVVEVVRLPRVLVAAIAGAGLALCGATLQGIFRNPLVGPQTIGAASGAALGGVTAILLWVSVRSCRSAHSPARRRRWSRCWRSTAATVFRRC